MEEFYFQLTTGVTVCSKKMINGIVAERRRVPNLDRIVFAYYLDVKFLTLPLFIFTGRSIRKA